MRKEGENATRGKHSINMKSFNCLRTEWPRNTRKSLKFVGPFLPCAKKHSTKYSQFLAPSHHAYTEAPICPHPFLEGRGQRAFRQIQKGIKYRCCPERKLWNVSSVPPSFCREAPISPGGQLTMGKWKWAPFVRTGQKAAAVSPYDAPPPIQTILRLCCAVFAEN